MTTGNYIYKDQPTCQNGRAIKVIWSRFVDIPNGSFVVDSRRLTSIQSGHDMRNDFKSTSVPCSGGSESSTAGTFVLFCFAPVLRNESSRERKFQGAKVPHLELLLLGANGLGSEKSSYRLHCGLGLGSWIGLGLWLVFFFFFFFRSTAQVHYVEDGNEVNVTTGEQCKNRAASAERIG